MLDELSHIIENLRGHLNNTGHSRGGGRGVRYSVTK
jgi:hypothetical protein